MRGLRLVLDWDGTVTEVDGLHMLLEEFGDLDVFARMEGELGRDLTLHEVIGTEISTLTLPLEDAVDFMRRNVTVRPGFHELAERYRPAILSSGFVELVEPVLEREGVDGLEILANRIDPRPGGWRAIWRDEAVCAECGEACKRASLGEGPLVFVGDGYSDRCAALAAERVFARDGLARYLDSTGVPYETFSNFFDLANALAAPAL
jgi:2-hydroxy-3-keto-5-methylthiopentenyl-1-phosphate phosphatase